MTDDRCALADTFCAGVLSVRRTAGGETVVLCAHHEAEHAFVWAGVVPALRHLAHREPERRAS